MEKITTYAGLRTAILEMESKQIEQGIQLREQFNLAYDSLRPINLIKSVFAEATGSTDIKDNLMTTTVGLTAGYLSKLLVEVVLKSPLNKFFGTAIMFGIKNAVTNNPDAIKSAAKVILNIFRSKRGEREEFEERENVSDIT